MSLRGGGSRPADGDDDEDDFYNHSGETQKLLIREQDETLKHLAGAVDRVQGMAIRVNEELSSQNVLLDDIEDQVEKTDSRMASLHRQLKTLANDKDRGKYCVIVCLLLLLAWLLMMVLQD